MKHIRTIIDKEWSEVFKNRMVLFTTLLLPLIFTAIPLVMLNSTKTSLPDLTDSATAGLPEGFMSVCEGMSGNDCMQVYLVNEFLILFMLMPIIIPITIAAYSIVGEKTTRSLEPLLATPITTVELLAGKCAAAVIPAIGASYLAFGLFNLGMAVLKISPGVVAYINSPTWLLAVLVLGPILAVISVNFALFISSRVNDPRVAEQISSVIVVPLMGLMLAQMAGAVVVNLALMLAAIGIMALVAFGMLHLGAQVFERETILTRWK
ncbi:MAG: ABC transporter permease subunit [Anaerolineaceae bacterium]